MLEVTKIYARGRVQIPVEVKNLLNVKDGDKIAWFLDTDGVVFIRKVEKPPVRYTKTRGGSIQ